MIDEKFSITIPEPVVNVEAPIVNVPEAQLNIPDIDLSPLVKEIRLGLERLRSNNKARPIAVRLTDGQDWIRILKDIKEDNKITLQGFSENMRLRNKAGHQINPATEELQKAGRLINEEYDFIDLDYTGSNLTTVTYKTGGSGGTTVATLTLTYSGSNLDTVTKA